MKKFIIIMFFILLISGGVMYVYLGNKENKKPNNNEIVEPKEKEDISPTLNKNIIFFGDSITYGHITNNYSWVNFIKDNYDFNLVTNAGISDYRVSTYDDPNKWLVSQVQSHSTTDYDYIIMQGGINDVIYLTPLGEISSGKDSSLFDPKTFAGGLELYINEVKTKWPNAKVGYIISYFAPNYTERGLRWTYDDHKKYVDLTKDILNKWEIKYIDLFDDKYSEILKVHTTEYLPDHLHLNIDGYRLIYPDIYEWIKSL